VDPTYEKEGVTAIRADLQWGFGNQISLIAKPRDSAFRDLLTLRGPARALCMLAPPWNMVTLEVTCTKILFQSRLRYTANQNLRGPLPSLIVVRPTTSEE